MLKAIVYDFDGTLTPETCPKFDILEKSGLAGGCSNPEFFREVKRIAKEENLDVYDAMIRHILAITKNAGFKLTDENIALGADERVYRPQVEAFLQKYHELGVQNYLLSSGSKVYLEHTCLAPFFNEIFASTLTYDENGEAIAPDHVMSTEAKIDSIKAVAESLNHSSDDCQGIVYIGDGPTDIPVMTYTKKHGGITIMIYDEATKDTVAELLPAGEIKDIITYELPADFRNGGEIDQVLSSLL